MGCNTVNFHYIGHLLCLKCLANSQTTSFTTSTWSSTPVLSVLEGKLQESRDCLLNLLHDSQALQSRTGVQC